MVNDDATLLHQTNDDINKVDQKDRPILTVFNVWRQCLHVKCILLPMFSPENK